MTCYYMNGLINRQLLNSSSPLSNLQILRDGRLSLPRLITTRIPSSYPCYNYCRPSPEQYLQTELRMDRMSANVFSYDPCTFGPGFWTSVVSRD